MITKKIEKINTKNKKAVPGMIRRKEQIEDNSEN